MDKLGISAGLGGLFGGFKTDLENKNIMYVE